jgi:hypothetical protein
MQYKDDWHNKIIRFFYSTSTILVYVAIAAIFTVVVSQVSQHSSLLRSISDAITVVSVDVSQQQNTHAKKNSSIAATEESTKHYLPISEVAGLNNSIKLAESISLLGIFVAIVGIMLPLLGFFSIKHQRIILEDELNKKLLELEDKLKINIKRSIDDLPIIFIETSNVRRHYLIRRFNLISKSEPASNVDDIGNTTKSINSIFAAAFDLERALINLSFKNEKDVNEIFNRMANYIAPEDVSGDVEYIQELKKVLAHFKRIGVFSSTGKEQALDDFLKNKLMINPTHWYREISKK